MAPRQSEPIPPFLRGLIDDAAVFPPGNADPADALTDHARYRRSWYAPLVGPLLLPTSRLADLPVDGEPLRVGLVADTGVAAVPAALDALPSRVTVTQIEAKAPDIDTVTALAGLSTDRRLPVFAEISATTELADALDRVGTAGLVPKFRLGGLSAELFPGPETVAKVIVACAARNLRFKLTAGLHRAVRHTDPATGFTHHGFLNIAAATVAAIAGESVVSVTQLLRITESEPLVAGIRDMLADPRPLWAGFGSCSITEPLEDLMGLSLVRKESFQQ